MGQKQTQYKRNNEQSSPIVIIIFFLALFAIAALGVSFQGSLSPVNTQASSEDNR